VRSRRRTLYWRRIETKDGDRHDRADRQQPEHEALHNAERGSQKTIGARGGLNSGLLRRWALPSFLFARALLGR
jgi:hypothetical protein